jgi:roadblock/LC7 domain-containing protein
MIKRLLAVDGVTVVCRFRDDGTFVEGYGTLPEDSMVRLAKFAHDYKRIVQGNADQLSMFTQMRGWTPPGGWIVRGSSMSVCSVGNLVCLVDNDEGSLTEVMGELHEVSHW